MFKLILPATDEFDEATVHLEHSLLSLSKWETIHEKPFFSKEPQTDEEAFSYITQMVLDDEPPKEFINRLTDEHIQSLGKRINSLATATTFRPETRKGQTENITSELVYYWLVQFQIPFQPTETWHLNRLMTLVKIAGLKQTKPEKRSRQAIGQDYREINARRLKELGTTG